MSNSESSLVRPTQPGTPWAPPQPLTQGSDPTVPTAPELNPVPEGPSDRIRPADPTIPMALTDADSLLSVAAPEGMVRITLGEQSRFCFPCHMDGWQALGWTAHPPGLADGDGDDEGSPPDPPDPPAALPTINAIKGGPFVVKGEVVEAYVVGTGFSFDGDLEVRGESQAEAGDYNFLSATELSFQLDCSLITEPVRLPVVAVNSAGRSEPYLLSVVAAAAGAAVSAPLPDFAAMTKAQIIAEVERRYGVALDPGMTKAELVAEAELLGEAELLATSGPASAAPIAGLDEPLADADVEESALPLDLLR